MTKSLSPVDTDPLNDCRCTTPICSACRHQMINRDITTCPGCRKSVKYLFKCVQNNNYKCFNIMRIHVERVLDMRFSFIVQKIRELKQHTNEALLFNQIENWNNFNKSFDISADHLTKEMEFRISPLLEDMFVMYDLLHAKGYDMNSLQITLRNLLYVRPFCSEETLQQLFYYPSPPHFHYCLCSLEVTKMCVQGNCKTIQKINDTENHFIWRYIKYSYK